MRRFWTFLTHRKKIFIPILLIIVAGMIFWPKPPPQIETQTVKKGDITESISASGTIRADKAVDLTFQIAGKLIYLGVKKGDAIKKGQTIAMLDQRTMQKNLESALLSYSVQRTTFDQTLDDNNAEKISDAVNDTIKRTLQANEYNLHSSVVAVELQDLAKEQSVLTAPISGIVTRADVTSVGTNVTTGTTYSVADPDSLVFQIDVDEADIGKIRPDQTAKITLDAYPDETLDLHVNKIDFATHETTTGGNAYTVELPLPNDAEKYRIGMNGDAEIITNEQKDVLIIPIASIFDEKYVYVKTEKGFEKRKVTLGIQSDTEVEITSGLQAGEKVAVLPSDVEKFQKSQKKFFFF